MAYIARNIKTITSRSKTSPGVYVGVKGKDIPVGKGFWNVAAYAVLLGEGSYKGTRTTSSGANRGKFRGFENFMEEARRATGSIPYRIFLRGIDKEVEKALRKAINGR